MPTCMCHSVVHDWLLCRCTQLLDKIIKICVGTNVCQNICKERVFNIRMSRTDGIS